MRGTDANSLHCAYRGRSRALRRAQQPKTIWRALFDGTSLDAWRGYKTDKVPPGWRIVDGVLTKDAPVGDIVSKDEFGDFELELDWKIAEAGNSGIFYRGTEEYDHIYWSAVLRKYCVRFVNRPTTGT